MSIQQFIQYAKAQLQPLYDSREAENIIYRLLEHELQLSKLHILLDKQQKLSEQSGKQLNQYLQALKKYEPLQYVLGVAYFGDLQLQLTPDVLIPRPETEELVAWVSDFCQKMLVEQPLHLLDIGTGSGCIALSLKKNTPKNRVSALDISEKALAVAQKNAEIHQLDIQFIQANIEDKNAWSQHPFYDIIVSNPPYITEQEKTLMRQNVLQHEPALALFVENEKPLRFYQVIADFAKHRLAPQGSLFFELNEHFAEQTRDMLQQKGFQKVELRKDLNNKWRMLQATNLITN